MAGKLFISIGLGGVLKISHYITCLYRTVLEVNYLFHAESARTLMEKIYNAKVQARRLRVLISCLFKPKEYERAKRKPKGSFCFLYK